MCQMLAMNCNSSASINFSFAGFSARGGQTGEHADGWGIAFHERTGCRVFIDDGRASDSALADFVRSYPIKSKSVLAHIRKATQGAVTLSNCHPFQREWLGQHWVFCHNGDLKNYHPNLRGNYLPVGTTDSEKAFCWMLQELRSAFKGACPPSWKQVAPVLAELSRRIASHGTFNFLLSNGEAMYAHCSTQLSWVSRQHPFQTAKLIDCDMTLDLRQANGESDRMVLVATEPLTADEPWDSFAPGELKVFVDGAQVWSSTSLPPKPVKAVKAARAVPPKLVAVRASLGAPA
ncbi:class II glutamine amidotransferase [Rhodoferax sp.]|uniref:class II glutamine amidotransferase n=1 Tax=Rhodoferax sp. TaxID=50421 RepID=UPI0025CDC914|nr:class II glutamine amidotransferase [Rhodoferax sp.]